ncbi:MAG: PAS-domain containing protein [Pseudomonadota bacterium]
MLIVLSIGVVFLGFVFWLLFYVRDRRLPSDALTDGAVLIVGDGMVQDMSLTARELLGDCENMPIIRVLDDFLGAEASEARDAVNRLEMTGDPVDMIVRSSAGVAYELIGSPSGAMIRLILRDAELMDVKLRDAETRVDLAARALDERKREHATLSGLIEDAPLIAWHRTAEGEIIWCGGKVVIRNASIAANRAVELIVARTKLNRQPVLAGQPQKSRIEIVVDDSAETVSLHVVEIIRNDSSRIGFATDAGMAATAERTLTRFVQTMTETFAHLTVGLAIFDRNQTLALFNPALVQMWQVEPAWLARRPSLRDIIDELRATRRLPESQDFHKWRARLLGLFENTEAADYEDLWHLADGSNIRVLARPHPHGSLAFIFDDVTERVRLEQRYRHSIDLRRATLDRLTEGIAVFGPNGLLQFVNQAFHEIWGTDSDTAYAAMHARQLVSLCGSLCVSEGVWQRMHRFITGEEGRRTWEAPLEMGSGRVLRVRVAPLPDGSTMAVFSDARGGTLLPDGPPPTRSDGDGNVLTLGEMPEQVDLSSAVDDTIRRLSQRATAQGTVISARIEGDAAEVSGDPQLLRQLLFAMASEAMRNAGDSAEIVIGAGGTSDDTTLSVTLSSIAQESAEDTAVMSVARQFAARAGANLESHRDDKGNTLRLVCQISPPSPPSPSSPSPSSSSRSRPNGQNGDPDVASMSPKRAG